MLVCHTDQAYLASILDALRWCLMVVALTVTGTRPCTKATGTALVSVETTVVGRRLVLGNLHSHSLCVECEKQGKLTQATVVDHIVPHRGDQKLFWDESNWQPLCKPCHDKKTWNEDNNPTGPVSRFSTK